MFFRKSVDKSIEQRIESLEKHWSKLVEDRDMLREEFRRLRGTVTGGRRLRMAGGTDVSEIPYGDKEALRAAAGLNNGKRYTHDD